MINKLKAVIKNNKNSQKHSILFIIYYYLATMMKDAEVQCENSTKLNNKDIYLENKNNQKLINDMRNQIIKQNESLSRLLNDNKILKTENDNIMSQNNELVRENRILENKISEIENNTSHDSQVYYFIYYCKQVSDLKGEKILLTNRISQQENEIKSLKKQIKAMDEDKSSQLYSVMDKKSKKDDEILILTMKINDLEKKNSELKQKNDLMKNKYESKV